jgi:hypothetical protein
MRKIRRKKAYKFTEKRHSKLAIAALAIAVLSILLFGVIVWNSFRKGGAGSMYLGSAGIASMLLSFVALMMAVKSLFDENAFKLFPYLSTVVSVAAAGGWAMIYAVGFGVFS